MARACDVGQGSVCRRPGPRARGGTRARAASAQHDGIASRRRGIVGIAARSAAGRALDSGRRGHAGHGARGSAGRGERTLKINLM